MPGDIRSLQNCRGADKVPGGFDSHTPPPGSEILRQIPSVSELLESGEIRDLCMRYGEGILKSELRIFLEEMRRKIRSGETKEAMKTAELISALALRLERFASSKGRYAINATGILLHTGLGRSPLCKEAIEAISGMGAYSILQTDISSGKRSLREEKIERMLIELTGCEAATVVNNNAAATMLVLNTIAAGKRVVISRGQLIEIGGEFRMPDVMERSSVILHEVGTTNRTHLRDYERAIGADTGALLHVHTSNYRVRGFAGVPDIGQLCDLGRKRNIPVIDDLGSGALIELSAFHLANEPLISDSIRAQVAAACFSGDKLICGPQSGIICGKRDIIERIRKNPFARMFRVCKLTLAALEATLIHFINGTYAEAIPFYRMLRTPVDKLDQRARSLKQAIDASEGIRTDIADDTSYVGSGSLPDEGIPTRVVRVRIAKPLAGRVSADQLAEGLRNGIPSVFCRIQNDALHFDMRTIFDGEEARIADSIRSVLGGLRA